MDQSVTLTIDGREVAVPPGTTVLEAARRAGIEIPSLCYQEKLLPAGLCRLCLVEIEKMRGLQPACSTIVREGMVVRTDTPLALHNRRMILELLCTNHPLDCPVCDAAGDCRLQDYVFRYGRTESRFVEEKRHKGKAIPLGPLVMLDQERCVLCQRCVRFCEEVLDDRQLAVFQRGCQSRIGTFPGQSFDTAFSGNVIDLCPVGALTSRVFRFKARTWELESIPSTCAFCAVGCRLTMDVRNGRLLRQRGREAPEVNDGWLCDLGRAGHGITDHPERLREPLLRRNGRLEPTTWEEALAAVAEGLNAVREETGPSAVAVWGSPRLTNEAAYLLSKLARAGLGTNNVDCRLGTAIPAPAEATLAELRRADVLFLFQGDPSEEAPVLELLIRDAVRHGGRLYVVHSRGVALGRRATLVLQPRPGSEAVFLAGVLAAAGKADEGRVPAAWRQALANSGTAQVASLTGCEPGAIEQIATALMNAQRAIIAYGAGVRDEATMEMLTALARATGARLLGWNAGPNMRGVADMGLRCDRLPGHALLDDAETLARCERLWGVAVPRKAGVSPEELWQAMEDRRIRALYLVAADPLSEAPGRQAVERGLAAADFVVVQDSFLTPTAAAEADVVLPAAVPGEQEGTSTNLAGWVGSQRAGIVPPGEARPHWQIVADLARRLGAPGEWEYASAAEVLAELSRLIPAYGGAGAALSGSGYDARLAYTVSTRDPEAPCPCPKAGSGELALLSGPVLFDRDVYAAHAPAVAGRAPAPYVGLNTSDAARLGIADGSTVEVRSQGARLRLQAWVGEAFPAGVAFVPEQMAAEGVNALEAGAGVVTLVEVRPVSGEEP